jgi:hypothetical protein
MLNALVGAKTMMETSLMEVGLASFYHNLKKLSYLALASHLTLLCRQGHQPLWLLRQSRCEHTMSSEDTLSSEAIVALEF